MQRGGMYFLLFLLFSAISIIATGIVVFQRLTLTDPLSPLFLEQIPPKIELINPPKGLGNESVTLSVQVDDEQSGLDQLLIRIVQDNKAQELLRKNFQLPAPKTETIAAEIDPKKLGLKEGNVEIQALAFDKALWSNGTKATRLLEVNFSKPHISLITPQQNGVHGGSELVFYKITGRQPETHGVISEGKLYQGFSAQGWSDAFQGSASIFVTLYPIPQTFSPQSSQMKIQARDNLGNTVSTEFPYRIRKRSWSTYRSRITNAEAADITGKLEGYAKRNLISIESNQPLDKRFRHVATRLSQHDDTSLSSILATSSSSKLWSSHFIAPVRVTPSNTAGDLRIITLNNQEVLRARESGARFTTSSPTAVLAANSGKVIFRGQLGLLGNTVVVDHGLGLASIYSHLSTISVDEGRSINRGEEIGTTGRTGFSTADEVYFQIRLHGAPVSPNEWWDKHWVADHIENKVAFVLRSGS
jgi:murein DD-endopeptidase MepM/ murein hydrolase activator NlpD